MYFCQFSSLWSSGYSFFFLPYWKLPPPPKFFTLFSFFFFPFFSTIPPFPLPLSRSTYLSIILTIYLSLLPSLTLCRSLSLGYSISLLVLYLSISSSIALSSHIGPSLLSSIYLTLNFKHPNKNLKIASFSGINLKYSGQHNKTFNLQKPNVHMNRLPGT